MPLIAIQMRALRIGEVLTLDFATVVNELTRGLVDEDEDEDARSAPADRAYWEGEASKETVALADDLLALVRISDPTLGLNYTKFYIGLQRHGQVCNFATFRPRKTYLVFGVRLPETEELTAKLDERGIETQPYERRDGAYRLRLAKKDFASRKKLLGELLVLAFKERGD